MNKKRFICVSIIAFLIIPPLNAQYETLLIRFSPDVAPFAMALGGLGTTLFARADGLFYNPSLASSMKSPTLQLNLGNESISGQWPKQTEPDSKREFVFNLSGSMQGVRSFTAVYPWQWQNLSIAFCGGWQRSLPYGIRGSGADVWTDPDGSYSGTTRMHFEGRGAQDGLWFGVAASYQEFWGFGLSYTSWSGESEWQKKYSSDFDDLDWSSRRRERIEGGFWTIAAFFKPTDTLLMTAALQSKTHGTLVYRLFDDSDTEETEADDELIATVMIPEALVLGLCLGPIHNTSVHAEYYNKFWSRSELVDHPQGTVYPGMEVGLSRQQNAVRLSVGVSHSLILNPLLDCTLAAGLGWEQPLFSDEQGEAIVLNRFSLGAVIRVGSYLKLSASFRSSGADWPKSGRFDPYRQFVYSFSRSTLLLGIDFYPEGSK